MTTLQNVIAVVFDFDLTLSPSYMQEPIFKKYGVEGPSFWKEKAQIVKEAKEKGINADDECAYLNLILRYVKKGIFAGLSNQELRELGREIELFPGLPEFFLQLRKKINEDPLYQAHGIKVEFYVVSTGIKEMVMGSALGKHLHGVFASEFLENDQGVISEIARAIGYAKKTEFIHLINKGGNINPDIDLNGKLPRELRRVPFENMIFVGDGPSDVPCFATLNHRGGISIGVFNPKSQRAFEQAYLLRKQNRVFDFGPGDYTSESHTSRVLGQAVKEIANRIVKNRVQEIKSQVTPAPQHLDD